MKDYEDEVKRRIEAYRKEQVEKELRKLEFEEKKRKDELLQEAENILNRRMEAYLEKEREKGKGERENVKTYKLKNK